MFQASAGANLRRAGRLRARVTKPFSRPADYQRGMTLKKGSQGGFVADHEPVTRHKPAAALRIECDNTAGSAWQSTPVACGVLCAACTARASSCLPVAGCGGSKGRQKRGSIAQPPTVAPPDCSRGVPCAGSRGVPSAGSHLPARLQRARATRGPHRAGQRACALAGPVCTSQGAKSAGSCSGAARANAQPVIWGSVPATTSSSAMA